MNKTEFVQEVAARAGVPQKEAQALFRAMEEVITEQVSAGERVILTGFGTFERRQRQGRMGVNPHTGERLVVPPSVTAGFKPGAAFKTALSSSASA